MRLNSVLDLLYELYNSVDPRNFHNLAVKKLVGEIVITRYFYFFTVRNCNSPHENQAYVHFNPFTSANRFCGLCVMSSDIKIQENRFARFSCRLVC